VGAASGVVTHWPLMHMPIEHAVPSGARPQAPAALHAWQSALHACSQHTLFTQKPDMHWVPMVQESPRLRSGAHRPLWQVLCEMHCMSELHDMMHDVPEQ
jgi:hypothetical protein